MQRFYLFMSVSACKFVCSLNGLNGFRRVQGGNVHAWARKRCERNDGRLRTVHLLRHHRSAPTRFGETIKNEASKKKTECEAQAIPRRCKPERGGEPFRRIRKKEHVHAHEQQKRETQDQSRPVHDIRSKISGFFESQGGRIDTFIPDIHRVLNVRAKSRSQVFSVHIMSQGFLRHEITFLKRQQGGQIG